MLRRINVNAFGLAMGVTWAGGIFFLGFAASFGYGVELIEFVGKFYLGYGSTLTGTLIVTTLAFFGAYIGGVVFAWL